MKKSTFYFICERIYPDQIQSLVLSDDKHTPGQIKLFMSLLPLIQFNNLESITIFEIRDANLLCLVLSHLEDHPRIQSLSVDSRQVQLSKKKCRSITKIMTTLSSLKYLTFMDSSPLITLVQPLSKLTHLTIRSCKFSELQIIFHWVPNLVYLQIYVSYNNNNQGLIFDYVPPHLSSLAIKSEVWIPFNGLENLFSLTPSLKSLVLETPGEQDLLDGKRWETLIKKKLPYLTKFELKITPDANTLSGDDVLTPFQNPFWTSEKHWHMACLIQTASGTCARLFSVPYFAPSEASYPVNEGFLNYSLTPYSFDDDCTELRLSYIPSPALIPSPFKHVKKLSFDYGCQNIDLLEKVVNLSMVTHLIWLYTVEYQFFADLLQAAPNIYQLSMSSKRLIKIIDSLPDDQYAFEHIKKLNVEDTVLDTDIDKICRIFPKLEYVSLSVKHRDDVLFIFNGLKHLTSATISWIMPFNTPLPIMDEILQGNNICTDGTFHVDGWCLSVWID